MDKRRISMLSKSNYLLYFCMVLIQIKHGTIHHRYNLTGCFRNPVYHTGYLPLGLYNKLYIHNKETVYTTDVNTENPPLSVIIVAKMLLMNYRKTFHSF